MCMILPLSCTCPRGVCRNNFTLFSVESMSHRLCINFRSSLLLYISCMANSNPTEDEIYTSSKNKLSLRDTVEA